MVDAEKVTEISEECQRAIKSLWEDKGIQTCFDRRNEFHISDSDKLFALCIHCIKEKKNLSNPGCTAAGSGLLVYCMQLLSDYKLACWLTCSMDISFDHVHDVSSDKEGGSF